jgi:hypothetical protein
VLVRDEMGPQIGYEVQIYLPQEHARTRLFWDEAGEAQVEPALADPWVHGELLKLARVLKRDPRSEMTRWRGR